MATDPLTSEPLYKRAETALVARIVNREWRPGERIPNEFELAEEFGVSQGTIRKALMSMERRGLLERSPGRGTTVSRTTEAGSLFAFFRLRDATGNMAVPSPGREELTRRAATEEERALLQPDCDEVYALRRVRLYQGRPFTFEEMALPACLLDGVENDLPLPNSLYPYLQDRFGIAVMSARESLSAVLAGATDARMLEVAAGPPPLRVRRISRDLADRQVEVRISHYLTDTTFYQVDLERG